MAIHIAVVAGEPSADLLGASLIDALRQAQPDCRISGVGGPLMCARGLECLAPMERLAVMGLVEPALRLPSLLALRRRLERHFTASPPDVFVGIDAPDFNLGLETQLRRRGIPVAHYVSPQVWAWRARRVRTIGAAADRVLCLFPFEPAFYLSHGVAADFVGHPLADELELEVDQDRARQELGIEGEGPWVALLPGSRRAEIRNLGALFLAAAAHCRRQLPGLRFLLPAATAAVHELLVRLVAASPGLKGRIRLLEGQSRQAMAAADAVLLASGTATLEAMLLKRPMVVAYRMNPLGYWLVSRLLKVPYVALPNLLMGRSVVAECLQSRARPALLAAELLQCLRPEVGSRWQSQCRAIHRQLRQGAAGRAAEVVLELARGS